MTFGSNPIFCVPQQEKDAPLSQAVRVDVISDDYLGIKLKSGEYRLVKREKVREASDE